ncbi:hypothetical protein [uncultured Microscilla sp.]|uniref:hypothetical protein n=1 Tax=uncultured Microscilla sp. TaxID=432653 RepID=UPI002623911D|nr:hypothetical protein [uncultured Microscilla sp.]
MTKQEKMYAIVSGYDEHTMDHKTYSVEQGITLNMFCYWRGKWLKEQPNILYCFSANTISLRNLLIFPDLAPLAIGC